MTIRATMLAQMNVAIATERRVLSFCGLSIQGACINKAIKTSEIPIPLRKNSSSIIFHIAKTVTANIIPIIVKLMIRT